MDFEETPEEQAFRAEVRAWLEARAKRRQPGTDPEHFYSSNDTSKEADAAHVRACKAWQQTLYDAGWAGIAWPKEFGGRGGAGWQQRIFNEEQSRFDVAAGRVRGRHRDGRARRSSRGAPTSSSSASSRRC